jgi:hypothetical protein
MVSPTLVVAVPPYFDRMRGAAFLCGAEVRSEHSRMADEENTIRQLSDTFILLRRSS